ncbi:MAG: sugar ABC transporter substrate-binding protein, partial [Hyphomicrobiales bacterium]|nr:sugar ABC transporter substrate-binding protein [Hyphomicrobiales bacterium]
MQVMKWLGGAAAGAILMLAGSPTWAVTIGFSQVGDEGDWRPAFSKDMQEEAKKEGIDLK